MNSTVTAGGLRYDERPLLTILIVATAAILFISIRYLQAYLEKPTPKAKSAVALKQRSVQKPVIVAEPDYNWQTAGLCKHFPFKDAEFKLNMGITALPHQDYLVLDPTYKTKLENKKLILENRHPAYPSDKDTRSSTVFYTPEADDAIREYYDYVVSYFVSKYPQYFKKKGNIVHNTIVNEYLPYQSEPSTHAEEYLIHLTKIMEEDFIFMIKDPKRQHEEDGSEYFFKAGIFAFAAGFDPKDRFDTPLSFIHHPIPGYKDKLKIGMNKFFDRMVPYQCVMRGNYSVQTHDKFYVDDSNKGHNLAIDVKQEPLKYEDLDFKKQVHYRSERQTLFKLPRLGAIIFTIRTFLTPMARIKEEPKDVRMRFVGAIKKFPEDIAHYKRAKEWGPAVVQYLEED